MPNNELIPDEQAMPETAQEKFERERFTRRQALKRFGMTSAMTAFALFSVDDLARAVGKAMQQRAGDSKIAGQVAGEFQQSGVAFGMAAPGPLFLSHPSSIDSSPAQKSGEAYGTSCAANPGVDSNGRPRTCLQCLRADCAAAYPPYGFGLIIPVSYTLCEGAGNPKCGG